MPVHDTLRDLPRGTPPWFTGAALVLPLGLLAQFLSAGRALFGGAPLWDLHGATGGLLALPVLALMAGAATVPRLRGFGWWAGIVLILYVLQVVLAAGSGPAMLSLHPVNGALLLSASLVLPAKVERRLRAARSAGGVVGDGPGQP